jgi:hypothetical protein
MTTTQQFDVMTFVMSDMTPAGDTVSSSDAVTFDMGEWRADESGGRE